MLPAPQTIWNCPWSQVTTWHKRLGINQKIR
jgi:hypothetical protein